MRKVREVLRLKYEGERSHAEIAASVGVGESTVGDYLARAREAKVDWQAARELTETELEAKLFRSVGRNEPPARVAIDFGCVHRELSRPGVTLQTVWVEYREAATGKAPLKPYEYSRFCDLYARWKKTLGLVMRQVHRAGEKVFVDYSGKKPRIVDPETGEVTEVELFVAVLAPAISPLRRPRARRSSRTSSGRRSAPSNTSGRARGRGPRPASQRGQRAGSVRARHQPDLPRDGAALRRDSDSRAAPASARQSEGRGGGAHRAAMDSGGAAAPDLLQPCGAQRGDRGATRTPQRAGLPEARRVSSLRLRVDRQAGDARVPARRYEVAEWRHAKVNIDYCITFDHRLYSVPYALVGQEVHIRATVHVVEILHKGERVASHRRSFGPKGVSVIADEHRPRAHRDYGRWPPERIVSWAASIGPHVGHVATAIMRRRTHPETGYRACFGLIRLADRYGRERVDAACARALAIESPSFKSVSAILKKGLDRLAADRGACSRADRARAPSRRCVFRQGGAK